ncbi:hypothetical protein ACLIKD_15850 [Azonexus sp. IMCC34842]|uniref:hypothetical protein n=1 Tax=Azonexus sp. IMCC34842 TaxID=3420950 RepID=UPI003D0EC6AE
MQHDDRRTFAGNADVNLGAVVGKKVGHGCKRILERGKYNPRINTVEYGNV